MIVEDVSMDDRVLQGALFYVIMLFLVGREPGPPLRTRVIDAAMLVEFGVGRHFE